MPGEGERLLSRGDEQGFGLDDGRRRSHADGRQAGRAAVAATAIVLTLAPVLTAGQRL